MSFGRKAAIAAVAFATVGSTLFGGAALAGDDHGNGDHPRKDHKKVTKVVKAGDAGTAKGGDNFCLNLISGNQLLSGVGLLGFGKAGDVTSCSPDTSASADGGNNIIGR